MPQNLQMVAKLFHLPARVMVWTAVESDGSKFPFIFIEESLKVNSVVYMKMLEEKVPPWLNGSSVTNLKQALTKAWSNLDEETVRRCCGCVTVQLGSMIKVKRGNFE